MISGADEDGRVMVEFSEPVGGRVVKSLTPEEINSMLYKEETAENPADMTEENPTGEQDTGQERGTTEESALERIPKDAQTGEPQYTQTDAPTAWDAIVEQTEGDEDMARSVVDSTVRDKEAALKKLESSNPKPGATVAEKIAAAKEHKAAIEAARQELEQWKAIAEVENSRKAEAEAKAKAEEEEAKAKAKAEEERTALKGVNLSEEKDENGNSFVVSSDGTTTFGEVRDKSGLPAAPIKLSVGYQDKNGSGYGLIHIEANHGAQIKKEGFASVEDFVSYVAKNYDENNIKVGKRRTGGSITYLLQVTGKHDNTLFIELSRDGSYWNVNSAGVFRKGYSDKKETAAKTEPQQPSNAISERALQSADQSNGILPASPNGKPAVSASKVSESPETKQEKAEKSISAKVKEASADVNTEPTEAQKEAGNYKKGHVQVGAFDITIEQPEGSIRRGTDADGKQWESKMHNTYGYFRGTEGVGGDHIDVFLSNDIDGWNGRKVYVVDQYNPDGTFDEHKVMLGFNDMDEAKGDYLANYEKGWENGRRIDVSAVNLEDFEKWIASSHRKTKPFSEYKSVKPADDSETFKGHKVENSGKDTEAQIKHLEEIKDYPGADKKIVQSEIDRLKAKEEAKAKSKSEEVKSKSKEVKPKSEEVKSKSEEVKSKSEEVKSKSEEVKSKSEEKNGVDEAKIEAVSEALSKGDEKAEQLVRGLTSRELSKLRSKVKASPLLENEWLHRVRTRDDVSLHDWMLENQYVEPVKRVSGTFKMTDYIAPKDSPYAERIGGVYHDKSGFAVATDGRILVADKGSYDPKLKGKIIGKDGVAMENKFPDWQEAISTAKETKSSLIDVEDLHRFVAGVLRANKRAYISLRFPDGTVGVFKANRLNLTLRAMKQLGTSELLYTKDGMILVAKSEKGTAMLMGLVSVEDELVEANGYAYPGNTVSYYRGEVVSEMSQEERVLRDAVIDRLRESGMEVITDEEAGQRVLDEANGKVRQMSFGEPYDYAAYPYGRVEPNLAEKDVNVVAADANHGFNNYKEAKTWAKQNVSKSYNDKETGGKGNVRISNAAIDKFLSQSAVDKSDSKDVHMAVLKVLPGLLKTSIDVETHPDFIKGEDGKRNAENGINKDVLVHRCYGAVSLDGKLYRVKITLKEDPRDLSFPHVTHSYEATKIELLAGTWENRKSPSPNTRNSITAAKLLENVGMSYNPGEKVLAASEKRSANIREQRVYHGSGADFDRFDHSHIGEGEGNQAFGWGTYVTEVEGIGRTYAEQNAQDVSPTEEDFEMMNAAISEKVLERFGGIDTELRVDYDGDGGFNLLDVPNNKEVLVKFRKYFENHPDEFDGYIEDYDLDDEYGRRDFADAVSASMLDFARKVAEDYKDKYLPTKQRILYTVDIPDDNGRNYLDWNGHPAESLLKDVSSFLESNGFERVQDSPARYEKGESTVVLNPNATGADLYAELQEALGSDKKASQTLAELGYIGIKYPADYMRGGREDGKKNYVIFDEKDAKITDRVRFFRTAKGEAYGFTVGGKIYIDPKIANTETPIHEYAHLWAAALRGQNPKEWQNIVELMKGTSVWDEVKKRYPELNTDDDIADEVLATYSGRRGAERLREEQRKIAEDKGGVFEKAEAISALERVKQALQKFWKSVADFLHIHYKSAEEVADRVMKDLLDGVDPNKAARGADFRDFAEKYGVDENLIKDYADAMERGDVFAANRGIQDIRHSLRIKNTGKSFREFAIDVYRPVQKELYARFGNADELTKQYEEQIRRERLALDSARKRAEEEQRKRKEREAELEQMSDGERDRRYMEALAKGNETVARELLSAAARSKGYADIKSDYQGVGAWAAPSNPGFETDEERRASIDEDGGEANVEDIALGHSPVEEVMFYHPERVGFGDATGIDAGHVISRAIDAVKRGGKNVKIKVYRAVPNAIKEGRLRNGDWVTPSKKYAQMHGENRLEGNYRIIEDEVPASQLWFDGNDVREWGFDDGKSYRYKNVKNNRKSDDLVTRDDNGNIIPPSKRFNSRNDDPRFMLADTENSGKFSKKEDDIRYRMDESKSERIEKLRESKPVEITGDEYKGKYELNRESAKEWLKNNLRGEYRIKDTGETVELRKDGIQKVTSHSMGNEAHLKSLAAIPQMIENSIFIDEVPNEKNNGKYDRYRYYVCGLKIGGEDYTAKITIGVKGSYKYYDHSLTQIEKGSLLDNIDALSTTYDDKGTTLSSVGKDSRLLSILQVKDEKKPNDGLYRVGGSKELRDGRKIEFVRKPTATYNALARHLQAEGIKPDMHEAHTGSRYMSFEKDGVQWEVRSSDHTKPEYYGEAQKPVELTYYKDKQGEENLSVSVDLGTSSYNIEDMKALMAEIDRLKNDAGEVKESFDRGVASDEVMERYPLLSQALGVKSENEVRAKEEAREHAEEARKQEMRSAVEDMAGGLHLSNVDIVDKPAGRGADRRERAKGMFERSTGRITINIGNCADKRDAVVTLLHEAVAHHGLRKLFGENFETFLDNVYNSANAEIRRIIDKHSHRYDGDKRTATEEYMASLAERTDFENAKKSGWWQRIKDFFLKMLEKIGLKGFKGEDLSDNELRYVLWRSYENLKSGGKDTVFSAANDLAKQSELKVGEFAPGAKAEGSVAALNTRFNNELQQQIDGNLPSNHIYQMGNPGKILLSTGVPDLPIQMNAKRLQDKATLFDHNFELYEVKDLVKALQNPLAVFSYGDKTKAQNIIVPLQKNGKNFIVGLSLNPTVGGKALEINSIRNVFPKDNSEWLNWISQGKALYLDKEKIQTLIAQQRTNLADVEYLDLDSAAKVVENFENPKFESENDALFRDGDAKDYEKAQARETYERRVSTGMFQSREAIQDSMLSLKVAMDAIEEATAGKAKRIEDYDGFENAYLGENRLSSVNQAESAAFAHLLIRPMMEEVNRLAPTAEDRAELIDYMFAKHGLERNAYMRQQAAEKKLAEYKKQNPGTAKTAADFIDAERDYAGLTTLTGEADVSAAEAEAQRMVADYENDYTFHGTWNEIYVCRKKIC